MILIGRKEQKAELERCARSEKPELVCVYGRRRVGKTFLVEETFSGTFAFRATGVESESTRFQLKSFYQRLREFGDTSRKAPADWFEAFSRLGKILSLPNVIRSPHGKRVVFLDEFPWMAATSRSGFLEAFGEFWNRFGTANHDLVLIICGSATSWIIRNILEDTGDLYDRVTCQIYLRPFTLHETERFFQARDFGWSRMQLAECQMIFGGLPFFLNLMDKNESLVWNVDHLCFQQGALLRNESKRLLETTLKKSDVYSKILAFLSDHPYGVEKQKCENEIHAPHATFFRAVEDLKKCAYIIEYKTNHNRDNPLWLQLMDPFLLFHYHFLSEQENAIKSYSAFKSDEGKYINWRGHAFENLCLSHIEEIRAAMGISGVEIRYFPWTSDRITDGAQIDLVIERADGLTNLCEMKFTDHPFSMTAQDEETLLHKRRVYQEETGTHQALKLILISAGGIKGVKYTEQISRVLTLDDLFDWPISQNRFSV